MECVYTKNKLKGRPKLSCNPCYNGMCLHPMARISQIMAKL